MKAAHRLYVYVLEKAAKEPTAKRAKLYRVCAEVIGDDELARTLVKLADELDSIDRRSRQLLISI